MSDPFDYIVIGAGHNGMSAACTLAMAGKKVLIVEQRAITGGLSISHAFVKDAPSHLLSIGAMDDALMAHSALIDTYHLRSFGYAAFPLQAPYGWMNEDGDTLLLHTRFDRTVDEIKHFSPRDAGKYGEIRAAIDFVMGALEKIMPHHPARLPKTFLAKTLLKLAVDRPLRRTVARMLSVSAFEMIGETFESDAMRGLWAFWAGMFAPATVQGSGLYLASFGSVHRAGIFRPAGGMSGMIAAFEKAFYASGGVIRLNAPVQQILCDQNVAKGVRLANGEEISAKRGVLASCAPQVALGRLIADQSSHAETLAKLKFIPANSIGVAPFKIDIAVGGPVNYPKAVAKRAARDGMDVRKTTFMTGTLEEHMTQHKACLRGEPTAFPPPVYFAIMSANDAAIAPKGQDVMYVYANVPVSPTAGWTVCKQDYSVQIMHSIGRFASGLESEIGRVETSPQDFEEKFGAPNGAYFHVDMIPTRLAMNRPAPGLGGYETPFKGLYLASAGSHPSGGVCGWPGRLAAQHAMRLEVR